MIFPSSYRELLKFHFTLSFPIRCPVLPLLILLLPPVHPDLPFGMASYPGFTTALGAATAVQGRKRAVKCLGARASFWRKALAHWSRGRHTEAYLHMFLFHFHTLHANALWKVPSQFPPQRKGRGGWFVGGEVGPEWKVPVWQCQSASPWGRLQPPAVHWVWTHQSGLGSLFQWAPGSRAVLWPVRSGEFWAGCRALLQPPPRKFWSGARSRASCLYSPQPRGGNPKTFIRGPTSLMAFQVCAGWVSVKTSI